MDLMTQKQNYIQKLVDKKQTAASLMITSPPNKNMKKSKDKNILKIKSNHTEDSADSDSSEIGK